MRLFARVVETGSFSEAGRKLDLAPSSISRQIAALEERLGVRLLHRTTRTLSLTEAGQLYYERASHILADIDDAHLALTQLESAPRGTLRLNVPIAFGRQHVLPMVFEFLERYPELKVDMTFTDHFVDLVQEGEDLAIRIGQLEPSSLIARKLAVSRRVVCASPAYLEREGEPALPSDLVRHNCLTRKGLPSGGREWKFIGSRGEQVVKVSGNFQANHTEALHAAALRGIGIVCLSTWTVGPDVKSGALRTVLDEYEVQPTATEAPIYAVYPHNRHLSPKVRAFLDFLTHKLGPRPYWECGRRREDDAAGGKAAASAAPAADVSHARAPRRAAADRDADDGRGQAARRAAPAGGAARITRAGAARRARPRTL